MRRMMYPVLAAICGLLLFLAAPAQATLTFTLDLIDDFRATLTGVGSIEDVDGPSTGLGELDLVGAADAAGDATADGDFIMHRGDLARDILSVSVVGSGDLNLLFDGRLGLSYGPSGASIITLQSGQSWQPPGTSGSITLAGVSVGMWSIVPEPSPALLLGLGLTGLAFIGRKPRRV